MHLTAIRKTKRTAFSIFRGSLSIHPRRIKCTLNGCKCKFMMLLRLKLHTQPDWYFWYIRWYKYHYKTIWKWIYRVLNYFLHSNLLAISMFKNNQPLQFVFKTNLLRDIIIQTPNICHEEVTRSSLYNATRQQLTNNFWKCPHTE